MAALTAYRGDTFSLSITGLGSLVGRTKLWFTLKRSRAQTDANALVQIEETAGLIRLNADAGTAGQGGITVVDAGSGNITVTLQPVASALLPLGTGLHYDVQMLSASGVQTKGTGTLDILPDVTRATS